MFFIGIIAENKDFETIKANTLKKIRGGKVNLIHITSQNIENMQNIKFDTLVVNQNLSKWQDKLSYLDKIFKNLKYVVFNIDMNTSLDILLGKSLSVITYGLNQKSTVTVSSITEDNILVALQRNLLNRDGDFIEVGEINMPVFAGEKVYEVLICCILQCIYGGKYAFS